MSEWFANEEFWHDLYGYLFDKGRFANAKEELDHILTLLDFKGQHILDLCCGPGRHSLGLAKRGYTVTGVDKSPLHIKKAQQAKKQAKVSLTLIEEDMRTFLQPNSFDLVLNMFTSFGYFDDPQDDVQVMQNIYQNLRVGGRLILETMSKEILARIFQGTMSEYLEDGTLLVQKHEVSDDWSMIKNEWYLLKDNHYKMHAFRHRLYSAMELKRVAQDVGFSNITFYGSLKGEPYNHSADRLVMVASKGNAV